MNDPKSAPTFLSRDMLAFEQGAVFDLEVLTRTTVGEVFELTGMTSEGPFKYNFETNATGLLQSSIFRLPDVPIFISLQASATLISFGQMFGTVYLRVNQTRVLRLCSGYIAASGGIGWPITQSENPIPGRGYFKVVGGTNPAAGAECTDTVGDNEAWFIKGYQVTLVTDATVADRHVHFRFQLHSSTALFEVVAPIVQAASLTRVYHLLPFPALPITSADNDIYVAIPPELFLRDNRTITTATVNIQAGDNFGAPFIAVESFVYPLTD